MEKSIKESVKKIFASHTFEEALELTRFLRGDYIGEFGAKSWNGLVSYWKAQNVQPAAIVASEPEEVYDEDVEETSESTEETAGIENPIEEDNEESEVEETVSDEVIESEPSSPNEETEEIEYMLYRNNGEEVKWFGHSENFRHYPVGHIGMLIRMNNRGVSEGVVVASAKMSLQHVNLFHRCYAVIINMKKSYVEQLELASKALMNIKEAVYDFNRVPSDDRKLTKYVLNFK